MTSAKVSIDIAELISVSWYVSWRSTSVLQPYFLGSQGHVPSVHNPHLLFLQPTMTSARVLIDIAELISVSSCGDLHLFFSSSVLSFVIFSLQLLGLTRSCAICAQPTLIFVVFLQHTMRSALQSLSLSLPHRHLALHTWMGHFSPWTFSQHVKWLECGKECGTDTNDIRMVEYSNSWN